MLVLWLYTLHNISIYATVTFVVFLTNLLMHSHNKFNGLHLKLKKTVMLLLRKHKMMLVYL